MKEGLLELKGAQKHENSMVCEISQPKIAPAKMALGCEMISQPKALLCETLLWHTSAILQPPTSFHSCEMGCEIPKALKLQFLQPQGSCCEIKPWLRNSPLAAKCFLNLIAPSAKIFAAAKPPLGTRVPFRSPPLHFAVAKWAAKSPKL